jgi:outer membrane protein
MLNRKVLFVVLCFASLILPGFAQKPWSLEECIQYAIEHNIQIKRQQLAADISKNNKIQSIVNLAPSLGAGWNGSLNYGRTVDPTTYDFVDQNFKSQSMGLGADVNLFSGFTNVNFIRGQQVNLRAQLEMVEKAKDDLILNIATAYLQILFDQELLDVAKSQVTVTNLQIDKMQKLVEVGNKAMGDLLQIQAQAASDKLEVTKSENNLKISYLNLAQMLDLDTVAGFDIVKPEIPQIEMANVNQSVDQVYSVAEQNMPIVKIAEYNLEKSKLDLYRTWGEFSPSVTLSGQLYTYYSELGSALYSYDSQLRNNMSKTITLGVNIPIFNKYDRIRNVSNARIERTDAELRLKETKLSLYKTIQQAYSDASSALDKYHSAIEAVKSNEEAFKYTEQKFGVGILSAVEYNEGKKNLSKARADLVQAKYEFIFKTKILDFYLGKDIKL